VLRRLIETRRRRVAVATATALAGAAVLGSIALAGGPANGSVGDIWKASNFGSSDIYNIQGIDIGTLDLPKGSFLLQAKVTFQNSSSGADFDCWIHNSAGTLDESGAKTTTAFEVAHVPLMAVITQTQPDQLKLRCSSTTANSVAKTWTFTALRVGKVR
jgi:hypothetical protein